MSQTWRTRLLIAAAVLVAVAAVVVGVRVLGNREIVATPTESPTATATPEVAPSPPAPPQPRPFKVTLNAVRDQPMDHNYIYGRNPDRNGAVVKHAARNAVQLVQRYLNAAFVAPKTRFTTKALPVLLTDQARAQLRDRDKRALGVGLPAIAGAKQQRATARVTVAHNGPRVVAMTVKFAAAMKVFSRGGDTSSLRQTGVLVLRKTPDGWFADMIEVQLRPPRNDPAPKPPPPTPTPQSTPTVPTPEETS
jgi:hypothetical protein